MNEVYADYEKNRLVITYGKTTVDSYLGFAERVLEEASKLKKGFTIFSDLRAFSMNKGEHIVHTNVIEIRNMQKKLYEMGASEVIRVVDPQVWLFVAMQEAEKEVGYNAIVFDEITEARVALEDIESEIVENMDRGNID
ncbi:MAG: hypothetical protein CSA42_00360 [Gammaproteobacteria bacterium]|nr:MAG: hypothetical protein CSB21_00060 [Deltaproteobacteria bacterium]PIE48139.1 MAG: hypothetical protein CSA42_00360 [Gammaproteobacteria bacterium]